VIVDESRNPDDIRLRPTGNLVYGNIVGWNGKSAVVLPLELADNRSDYNLYLGVTQPTFSLGWHSTTSPLRTGLDAWRTASGQDMHSWFEAFELPSPLATAFEQRNAYPDWSPVLSVASAYSLPALSDILPTHTKPGPSLQLAVVSGDTGGSAGSSKPGKGVGRKNK
jgi:hypothetical protein